MGLRQGFMTRSNCDVLIANLIFIIVLVGGECTVE